jgi:hypothetical protein
MDNDWPLQISHLYHLDQMSHTRGVFVWTANNYGWPHLQLVQLGERRRKESEARRIPEGKAYSPEGSVSSIICLIPLDSFNFTALVSNSHFPSSIPTHTHTHTHSHSVSWSVSSLGFFLLSPSFSTVSLISDRGLLSGPRHPSGMFSPSKASSFP